MMYAISSFLSSAAATVHLQSEPGDVVERVLDGGKCDGLGFANSQLIESWLCSHLALACSVRLTTSAEIFPFLNFCHSSVYR